jgi:hypothetical protein
MTFLYDVTIKAHEKDYHKLKLVVNSLQYLNPEPENIYIISNDGYLPKDTNYNNKLISILDNNVIPKVDKEKIKYRPGWSFANLVSITQNITKNDYYLDVQSDNFFLKEIQLLENNKPKLFQPLNYHQAHDPYFNFNEYFFNMKHCSKNTYIIEFMMYNKILLNKLFESYGSREAFIEYTYDNIDNTKYPADQEIFGNLVCNYFNDEYVHVNNLPIIRTGYYYPQIIDEKQIEQTLESIKNTNPEMYAISIHTWT